jgi:hypothetical protein
MVWVDGSILVHVPGGEFIMGDGGDDNPIHTVALSSFWIYRTKVTNRMYSICIAAGKCTPPQDEAARKALADLAKRDIPVVDVDWQQAEAYCQFAQGHLPTEAQWEKTARGPGGNIYPWGDAAPACDLLNFKNCVGEKSDVYNYPAGKSYYDALDLSGNAFEWVADWYTPGYYDNSPGVDPLGPEIGQVRSVRSSGFNSEASIVSSARRFYLRPEEHRLDLGFRCVVRDPPKYEPFCEQVLIPGYPQRPESSEPTFSEDCSKPVFNTHAGRCIDQKAQLGNGSVTVTGGEIILAAGHGCSQNAPGTWLCTGTQGTSVTFTACLACDTDETSSSTSVPCPPGSYHNEAGECIGRGDSGLCANGFTYNAAGQCCKAGPEIPYPGCDPTGEYLAALDNTCQPGIPPLGDACGVVSVPLGICQRPEDDNGDNPCSGLDIRECISQQGVCTWDTSQNRCVPLP